MITLVPPCETMRFAPSRRRWLTATALLAFLAACLPLLEWYCRRLTDGSDEPLGAVALIAAVVSLIAAARFGQRDREQLQILPARLLAGAAFLAAIQLGGWIDYPLLVGLLAVAVLALSIRMPRGKAGIVALLVLSLPLVASLNFYAGYPLRLLIAEIARGLLHLSGLPVDRVGVMLVDGERLVGIDPPCAGVRMLWSASFVASALAARMRLGWLRTFLLLASSVVCVVVGNGLRAALVFFPESGRVDWPDWAHPGIGLIIHGAVLLAVFALSERLSRAERPWKAARAWPAATKLAAAGLIGLAAAGIAWMVPSASTASPTESAAWPATMEGIALTRQPLGPLEERFAKAFPGSIARFSWGDAEVILRRTDRPTRMMHPASDCLRASGFEVHSEPVFRDADGRLWGASTARKDGRNWQIHERYVSRDGLSCTDASSWYWQALIHPSDAFWTGITIIRPLPNG